MSLKVYNTLHNRLEEFNPIKKGEVGLYTCGPTVYDFAHIGNFRSYIVEDLVKRYFVYSGYKVKHVMNITDIDDKTIRKSIELGVELSDVTDKYIDAFFKDLETLNIVKADVFPRATEHIKEMTDLIRGLKEGGYAYEKEGSVYFRIDAFKDYGVLANIEKNELRTGVSVDADEYDKDSAQDFVLWKATREGEPFWDSEFGKGRPGWHIECSAMSMKYLGESFDVHMGGVDNIFPHHENEIAQAEAFTGKKFVNYWIHCQHLVVENQKMSKSAGNFYTLRDLLDKGFSPMAIRYLLISAHYRKMLNFSVDGLVAAEKSLKRIQDFMFMLRGLDPKRDESSESVRLAADNFESKFRESLDDDFNISGALGALFEFIKKINSVSDSMSKSDVSRVTEVISSVNSVLGIIEEKSDLILDGDIEKMIEERNQARKDKNYSRADEIRDELLNAGIQLIDTPEGVRWKKV